MRMFEPSRDFVPLTMQKIRVYAKTAERRMPPHPAWIVGGLSLGAALLGLANLAQAYFTLFAPVVCH